MDKRLRQLARRAQTGEPAEVLAFLNALIHAGEGHTFIHALEQALSPAEISGIVSNSPLVWCSRVANEATEQVLRNYFLKLAAETGRWHGILTLTDANIASYDDYIRQSYFDHPPTAATDPADWRATQVQTLYTYYQGIPENPGEPTPATWVDLTFAVEDTPRLGVVWLNTGDDYIPQWEGIGLEDARLTGLENEILGSYRLVQYGFYPGVYDIDSTPQEFEIHRIPDGQFRIRYCPEMTLHIVRSIDGR